MPAVPPESEADPGHTVDVPRSPRIPDEPSRIGGYRVLGVLGEGGMGTVFRAHDPTLDREVAIKVMLPRHAANHEARGRFIREAKAQAAIDHEHVVPIFQVGEDNGSPFIVMPLLKGTSLSTALKSNPSVPIAEVLRIGLEMAEGLAAAHERGLIHRDIKPSNVWLEGKRLRVKILDFGLAKAAVEPTVGDALTVEGAILGTPRYMSPEQVRGEPVDHRSDLFSLGIVLYQMSTGRLPFSGETANAALIAVAVDEPTTPIALAPSMPTALSDLIMRLLSKNPSHRPATVESVAEELSRIEPTSPGGQLGDHSWTSVAEPSTARLPESPRRSKVSGTWIVLAALPLVALAIGLALVFQNGEKPDPDSPKPTTEASATEVLTSPDWEWTEPEPLPAVNGANDERTPAVSEDGLCLMFAVMNEFGLRSSDLFESRRGSEGEEFGEPKALADVNHESFDGHPYLSRDGLTMVFSSGRFVQASFGGLDVWITTRPTRDAAWEAPANLGPNVNTERRESFPSLSPDGSVLYFQRDRLLYLSLRGEDGKWQPAEPMTTGDGVPLTGIAVRPIADGGGVLIERGDDPWALGIRTPGDGWELRELDSPTDEPDGLLTPAGDGRTCYFQSSRPGGAGGTDIWRIRRVPRQNP